jgi:hypothetical protein
MLGDSMGAEVLPYVVALALSLDAVSCQLIVPGQEGRNFG